MNLRTLTSLCFSALSCTAVAQQDGADAFVASMQAAHHEAGWDAHSGFTSRIEVDFGEAFQLAGQMTFDTAVGRSRMELDDGTVIVNDAATCWVSPADAPLPPGMARFQSLTWPYFLALPFKLDDPGAAVEAVGKAAWVGGEPWDAWRLSFDAGTGDAPDDWYLLFRDGGGRLVGSAYIVTYAKPLAEANQTPSGVRFGGFEQVGGVTVPTTWRFYDWTTGGGLGETPIGSVRIFDPTFVQLDESVFSRPAGEDVRVDPRP